MAKKILTLEELARLDGGRIALAWQQMLERLQDDCVDRPALKDPRKLTLTAIVVPKPGDDASRHADSCAVRFELGEAIPKRKSRAYDVGVTPVGLVINELSPDNAGQMTIDEVGSPKKGGRDAG